MAEFLENRKRVLKQRESEGPDPFGMMGKPLDFQVRGEAYKHCLQMGLSGPNAMRCVNEVADRLERDQPYEAMEAGMVYLDLTGVYRILAALLAAAATLGEAHEHPGRRSDQSLLV
jgi:hypothetical protein